MAFSIAFHILEHSKLLNFPDISDKISKKWEKMWFSGENLKNYPWILLQQPKK